MKKKQNSLSFILKVIGKKKLNIFWLLCLQALLGISGVFYALVMRNVIDQAVIGNKDTFIMYILIFVSIVLFQIIIRAVVRFLEEYSRSSFENQFKERLFFTLLSKDYKSVSDIHTGEWMNRLTSDTQVVSDGLTTIVPGIAGMLVRMFGALLMIIYLEPKFTYVLIPGGFLLIILTYGFRKTLKKLHKLVQEKDGKLRSYLQENLSSTIVVRAFAAQNQSLNEASKLMNEHQKTRIKRSHFSNVCNIGFSMAMNGAYIIGLAYCGYGLLNKTMSYGTLMAILQLISQVQNPFANITGYLPKYYAMIASGERLMEPEAFKESGSDYKEIDEIKEYYSNGFTSLKLNNIDFSYDEDNRVLNDFSFSISKGEFVALTGMSGCGKSTVLKIILGLYKPDSGFINLDDSYRRLFAYVPQGNLLMSGLIRDVVTMANTSEKLNNIKINKALSIACADFVFDLPDGIMTELGERGLGLSEGQMQRIAVARAIFSESPILILDEATSALDEETEKKLLENLRALTDKTVLIVTHRPAALSVCDRQVVFG